MMHRRASSPYPKILSTAALASLVVALAAQAALADEKGSIAAVKSAVAKALPLLQKGAAGHIAQRTCFACHHQTLPVLAMTVARKRGFAIDDAGFEKQLKHTHGVLAQWAKRTPDRKSFGGGQADTAGHALLTLELGNWQADDTTAAVVEYLLYRDSERDHWRNVSNRPPSEASPFTTTALALRGLSVFGAAGQKQRIDKRRAEARDWLLKTKPKDTEDRVYRLWGLKYARAKSDEVQSAAQELLRTQQKDGGWAQLDKLGSDAYATGSALVALHQAGGLAVSDAIYQRGVNFLLQAQKPDGSWLVNSRSRPFQTYFETGFPHGKDQWISSAASGWAVAALALACPPAEQKKDAKKTPQLEGTWKRGPGEVPRDKFNTELIFTRNSYDRTVAGYGISQVASVSHECRLKAKSRQLPSIPTAIRW